MVLFRYGKCIKHYKTLLGKYFAILISNCIKELHYYLEQSAL